MAIHEHSDIIQSCLWFFFNFEDDPVFKLWVLRWWHVAKSCWWQSTIDSLLDFITIQSNNVDNKRSLHIYSSRRIFKNRYGRILWILTCRTRSLRSSCACLANSKWTKFVILKMIYTLFVKGLYRFLDLLYQEFLLISPLCKKDN